MFDYVEVADFNKEQVESFVQNWFATSLQTCKEGQKLKKDFVAKLSQNKQIADLAVTPILLSLTCWVFSELKDFPSRRSQLYTRGLNVLLQQWDEQRGINREVGTERYRQLSSQEKQKLLSYVAHCKFEQEQYVLFEENELQTYIAEYLKKDLRTNNVTIVIATEGKHKPFGHASRTQPALFPSECVSPMKDISTEDSKQVLKAIEAQHGLFIERAEDIYSFSHLTFQEYFTAQYIIDHQQVENLVAKHLTDKRWREVFLLVADLMGESAGDLLLLMQQEAQKYINTPKLQQLLRWADEVTVGSAGDVKPVVKRALALAFAFAFAKAIANANVIAIANAYAYPYPITNVIAIAIAYAYPIANAYAIANANVNTNAYAYAIAIANANAIGYPIAIAIDKAINFTRELEQLKIFKNFNSTLLIKQLEALKFQVPEEKQPPEERQKFAEFLQESLLNAFNLTREKVDLSKDEFSRLDSYLYANSLIIECKQAAVEVPSKTCEAIEERMLLMDD